jgi:hypothetical protein
MGGVTLSAASNGIQLVGLNESTLGLTLDRTQVVGSIFNDGGDYTNPNSEGRIYFTSNDDSVKITLGSSVDFSAAGAASIKQIVSGPLTIEPTQGVVDFISSDSSVLFSAPMGTTNAIDLIVPAIKRLEVSGGAEVVPASGVVAISSPTETVRATTDILANVLNLDVSTFGLFRGLSPVVGVGQGWSNTGSNTTWDFAPSVTSTTFPSNSYILGLNANQTCGQFAMPSNVPIAPPYSCYICHPSINLNTSFIMLSPSNYGAAIDNGYVPVCGTIALPRPVTIGGVTFTNAFIITVSATNYPSLQTKGFSFVMNFQNM